MKNRIRSYIVLLVVLAVFIVVALVPPFDHGKIFTLSLIFGIVSILVQVYVIEKSYLGGQSIRSKLYGFAILRVGMLYMILQLIASITFMACSSKIKPWVATIVYVCLLALCIIGVIANEVSKEYAESLGSKNKVKIVQFKMLRAKIDSMLTLCERSEVKAFLSALQEEFRYSDPVSSDGTQSIEMEISKSLDALQDIIASANAEEIESACKNISSQLKERNIMCKMLK